MNMTPDGQKHYDSLKLEFLHEVGRDLTLDAKNGKIKPVVGREREIKLMIETLCRETKSNPVLLGEAGVGKTALAESLALKIYRGQVPDKLSDCRLFSVSASALIAGCNWYGMIETRVKNLLAEAKQDKVIVFVDEIHTLVGTAPDSDSTRDIAQQLKPVLARRGEIKLIGATTDAEYRRFIEIDQALERRFQPISVAELSLEHTFVLLKELAKQFRRKKKIEISESVLRLILSYSERFLRNRHFPDKAIDLLEQAVASAEAEGRSRVSGEEAAEVVQRMIGIPANLSNSLQNLEESIRSRGLFEEKFSKELCYFLRVSMQGLSVNPNRPHATVFLPGAEAAAAKAESLAMAISEEIFAGENRLIKINFAELNDRWEFEQMMGISRKQVSSEAPIARISKNPWCVIICENLESCRQAVREIWANAIENGFLILADNRKVYLSDAIILLSADVPRSLMSKPGFNPAENKTENITERLEKIFSKSLIRLCDFISFENEADKGDTRRHWLKEILQDNLSKRFIRQGIYLHWDRSVIEHLLHEAAEAGEKAEMEREINRRLLPHLLPFIEQIGQRLSVSVKYESGEIAVLAEELSEEDERETAENTDFQENRRRDFYGLMAARLNGCYRVETKDDFSTLLVLDGSLRIEIYISLWKAHLLMSFLVKIADRVDTENQAYLLEKNMKLRFGKFAVEPDEGVFFEYSMIAEHCTTQSILVLFKNFLESARSHRRELKGLESEVLTSHWLSDEAADWLESRRVVKK